MICPLCCEPLRMDDDAVLPGPLWSPCHAECFSAVDDEDESDSRTTTYHASSQGEPAAEHA